MVCGSHESAIQPLCDRLLRRRTESCGLEPKTDWHACEATAWNSWIRLDMCRSTGPPASRSTIGDGCMSRRATAYISAVLKVQDFCSSIMQIRDGSVHQRMAFTWTLTVSSGSGVGIAYVI